MSRYALTRLAAGDLEQIWEFIPGDHLEAADRVIEDFHDALEALADFPEMGHRRDDLADAALRIWPVHSYLIVYRTERRPIEIVRIVRGFRDLFPLVTSR